MVYIELVIIADKEMCEQTLKVECVVHPGSGYNWAANAAVVIGMTMRSRERTLSHIALMRKALPRPALPSIKVRSSSRSSMEDMIRFKILKCYLRVMIAMAVAI